MAHRTPEEKIEIAKRICELYATGKYTIASCCETEGLSVRQFVNWEAEITEVSQVYKQAKLEATATWRGNLKQAALTSLQKLVQGFHEYEEHQEVEPIYDKDGTQIGVTPVKLKKVKKYYAPHVTAVIFALKSMDPGTFKDHLPPAQNDEQIFLIGGKEIKF
jgi:hypothetical protein